MASYLVHPIFRTALATKNLAAGVAGQLCLLNALNLVATTAPTTVLLPPFSGERECVIVEDLTGSAGTNPITIDGNGDTIDGAATLVLSTNNAIAALVFDAGEWKRVDPVRLFDDREPRVPFTRGTQAAGGIVIPGAAGELLSSNGAGGVSALTRVTGGADFIAWATSAGGALPASGLLRWAYAAVDDPIVALNSAGTPVGVISRPSANQYRFGHATGWNVQFYGAVVQHFGSASWQLFNTAGTQVVLSSGNEGVQFGRGTPDFGGGAGVTAQNNATTVPTASATDGAIEYTEGGARKIRGQGGTITTIAPS